MDAYGLSRRAGAVPVPALCRSRAARRHADGENLRVFLLGHVHRSDAQLSDRENEAGLPCHHRAVSCLYLRAARDRCDADLAAFSALLGEWNLAAWDGCRQEDSTVLDGESFSLNVAFEDGSGIDAVGTNSFPDNYYEKKGAIQAFFEALMREYEIDADKIGYW